jgi:hypothetical protein
VIPINKRKCCSRNEKTFLSILSFQIRYTAVDTFTCNGGANQAWIWNSTDSTIQSKQNGQYLTSKPQL